MGRIRIYMMYEMSKVNFLINYYNFISKMEIFIKINIKINYLIYY